jgi:hypothetical protein
MGCRKHFLGLTWEKHDWDRRVALAENRTCTGTDMWSRKVPISEVICHTQHVCRTCGEVRDEGYCSCDQARGDACAIRLAWLAEHPPRESIAPTTAAH